MEERKFNKLTTAILGGTGKEGPGLAMRWALAGYKVIIGSRTLEKAFATASSLNEKLGFDVVEGMVNADAAESADINVLTVVQSAHQSALENLKDSLQGKILIDATARVDFRNPKPPPPPSAGRIAQDILGPGVKVVAAFQNIPASVLRKKLGKHIGIDVMVCSDDVEAANECIELAEAAGMDAFYAGGLENAVVIEGLTAVLIAMNKYYGSHSGSIKVTGINKPD
jgi:NADPH-dependent F420 reductase